MSSRPFCADVSREHEEPLSATASRIDHWLLVEYRGLWAPDPLEGSALPERIKGHLREQVAARPRSRLLFVRRPHRRGHPGLSCFVGTTREHSRRWLRHELESHEDLLGLDVTADEGEPLDHPLLAVCTHGKRDRCCARYGRPLYDALREQAEDDWVWQCSHVGGDRFAGNVVCFPEGLYFGRVAPSDVWPLVDEYLAGRILLERYRGRCAYSFPAQAAEVAVRRRARRFGIDDLALLNVEQTGEGRWHVNFDAGAADVELHLGQLTHLTCSSEALKRPRHYQAV